ncbi:MAG: ABC transporter substrate-binding protein [Tissierellia bacterium]|nr:ABC transporter substrate-binding protein [Tissierellia bacterium]
MKLNLNIKKLVAIALSLSIILAGCSAEAKDTDKDLANSSEEKTYKIGITQYMEHPSLDEVRQGLVDELKDQGINIDIDYVNAQGDASNNQIISEKFVKDEVDLIYAISTLSAQTAKNATRGTDIPVLFSAVTDPVYSQIVTAHDEIENITGVTDKVEAVEILKLARDLRDDLTTAGIIYNTGESNSEVQVDEVKSAAETLGMTVETVGITTINDIPQAVNTLSKKADILYIISDNMVASSIDLVANLAIEHNLLTLSTIESQAADGILMANGLSYYNLGKQAGEMAKKILTGQANIQDVHVEQPSGLRKIVNVETMEALGLSRDNKAFEGAEFVE